MQSCKAAWQQPQLPGPQAAGAGGGDVLAKGEGPLRAGSLKPATFLLGSRKMKVSAVLDQKGEAEVERLTAVD
eukprot:1917093-Amphidinium_carterae.1